MLIKSFAEARTALSEFQTAPWSSTYTLDRIRALLHHVGDPQESLNVIHIAGSSGKSSTAYYTAALLEATGAKVGLTVSPHMLELNERVQINHVLLPEQEFCQRLGAFIDLVRASGIQPSYFEIMVAFAFYEFARQQVDYAVVEVGVGGLTDSTNAISRDDKVCIITDIGLDHTNILGKTLPEIATQKAGIIHSHNHVFAYQQPPEVMTVIHETCLRQKAHLHEVIQPSVVPAVSAALPLFQQRNLYLAEQAVDYTLVRDGKQSLTAQQVSIGAAVYIPGRMEVFHVHGKTVVFDGAHNPQKMTSLVNSMQARYPDMSVATLVSFVDGRDSRWQHALDVLGAYADDFIITAFNQAADDMPKTSLPSQTIADYLQHQGKPYMVESDCVKAYELLLQRPEPVLLITGSLYAYHTIRPLIDER
jgi:dihydrofolate synthase / folylpolyglutamate synthase